MSVKFPFFGGGFWGGGGECRFYFYGRADFSDLKNFHQHSLKVFHRPTFAQSITFSGALCS